MRLLPLFVLLAACGPASPAMEGDFSGACVLPDFDIPIVLKDVVHEPEATFSEPGTWAISGGTGTLDNISDEPLDVNFSIAVCDGEDCVNAVPQPEGHAYGYLEWQLTLDQMMVLEGQENEDGSWSGSCWYTYGGTLQGDFVLNPK